MEQHFGLVHKWILLGNFLLLKLLTVQHLEKEQE
jgi:hypothetical protein